jgi:MFS family permease
MKSNSVYLVDAKGFKLILRALRHRNFRLFFGGQGISLIGTSMQQIAMSWLVYRLTNSAFLLGLVGFVALIPSFLFAPFTGPFVDRWNRLRILVVTQVLAMIQALILALLVMTGIVIIWHIIFLSLFLGVVNAVDTPTRQSFLLDLLEKKEDLGNAIALNSSMFNCARLLGPPIAGILISVLGEGMCFLLNAVSYLAVIMALLAIKILPKYIETRRTHLLQELQEGFIYAFGFAPIRSILLLLALVSFMGMPSIVLMPVFARDILHGGPHTLGFLVGSSGVGALVGALYLAARKSIIGLGRWIAIATSIFGFGLIAFSLSRVMWVSLLLMFLNGFGVMVQMASSNTLLQTIVDDDKRGRVMSFYTMAFMGMAPFGSLVAGVLASKIGAPNTLLIGGISCVVGLFMFAKKLPLLREMIRPIYVKMGIVSEVISGIQNKPPEY